MVLIHRVAPDAKLGATRHRSAIVPLHLVRGDGGVVPCTTLLVQRKYPLYYSQQSGAGKVCLTPKAHSKALLGAEVRASKVMPLPP